MKFFQTKIKGSPVTFTFLFKNKLNKKWELNSQAANTWPTKLRKLSLRSLILNQIDCLDRVIEPYFIESKRRYSIEEILKASLLHLEEVE